MNLRRFVGPAVLVVILGACSSSATPKQNPKGPATHDVSALAACRAGDNPLQLLAPGKLTGPAAGSVAAGRVTKAWSVDGGAIRVSPAAASSKPTVPMLQVACNLMAASNPNGFPLVWIAPNASTLGYGLLSVSTRVTHADVYATGTQTTPVPPVYAIRPAWILTTSYAMPSSCPNIPAQSGPVPSPTRSRPISWLYEVFAVDATTGRDSISYVESAPACQNGEYPATSSIPYETVSVPWRAGTVSPDRSSGSIQVYAPACETVPQNGAWVKRSKPLLQATVIRVVGPACGPSAWRTIDLHPGTVTQQIPQHLSHAAIGPVDNQNLLGD